MINVENCLGCQACVELCPVQAISFTYDVWGEGTAYIDQEKCANCRLCEKICPAKNKVLNPSAQEVYAVVSRRNSKYGSSGGFFYEIAQEFLHNDGVVYGAAFDKSLKLKHVRVTNKKDLNNLCKSKYLHSDMSGVYQTIYDDLHMGKNVLFVGTPCQTSAVKNIYKQYESQLLLVDFLCHGTGTQKIFDTCIKYVEKEKKGTIKNFVFRSKARKADHSFTYTITIDGRDKKVSGYGFEFPYYNAYLTYTIFADACYHCEYSQSSRVGDITLGDFWGIQKYNKRLKDYKGVSMISVNTLIGEKWFNKVIKNCSVYSYPIEFAQNGNEAFTNHVSYPQRKKELIEILQKQDEEKLVEELACKNIKRKKLYERTPLWIIRLYGIFLEIKNRRVSKK